MCNNTHNSMPAIAMALHIYIYIYITVNKPNQQKPPSLSNQTIDHRWERRLESIQARIFKCHCARLTRSNTLDSP